MQNQSCTYSQSLGHSQVVNLYDFDGVLASPFEEALFTLPTYDRDAEFVDRVSKALALDLSDQSPQSKRYICMQAIMWMSRIPIQRGPVTPEPLVPYHVITARCDRFAVARCHEALGMLFKPMPVKTMHVDHLPKGQMLQVLLDRHPECNFRFWDDNPRHIESALSLKSDRLEVFHVDNDMKDAYEEAELFYRFTLLDTHLS